MNTTPRFDLVDIAKTLQKRSRYILIVTIIAAVLGVILNLIAPKEYEAEAELFVASPLYADRSNIFRNRNAQFINYFGGEDDIDKIIAISKSDAAIKQIAAKLNLAKIYKLDTTEKEDKLKLISIYKDNFRITRTEYQGIEMAYRAKDPVLSANVTNEAIKVIEFLFRDFYNKMKLNICKSLQQKISEADSTIRVLGAANTIADNTTDAQIIAATKEQYITDRAKDISLLNEFSTGIQDNEMRLLHVISAASPYAAPKGLGLLLSVVVFSFIGFFFSVVWVLLSSYYKALTAVER